MPPYDPFASKRGARVAINPNFLMGGLGISLGWSDGGTTRIGRISPEGYVTWEDHDRLNVIDRPTMVLDDEVARELLAALAHHFRATSLTSDREDLLHERGRVDKLTDAMIKAQADMIAGYRDGL